MSAFTCIINKIVHTCHIMKDDIYMAILLIAALILTTWESVEAVCRFMNPRLMNNRQ